MYELLNCEHIPFSSIKVWSHGGWKLFIDPRPSVQSKLSARELFQPQKPFSKEQDVPQSFSSVPSPQSSMKSQVCSKAKHWPFSQDRKPEGQEPGNKRHIKHYSAFSWLSHNIRLSSLRSIKQSQEVYSDLSRYFKEKYLCLNLTKILGKALALKIKI